MKAGSKIYLTTDEGEHFFGLGPMLLLEAVSTTGSLNAAARETGISYSKALRMINNAEQALGYKLISRETGGPGGGGSTLTPEAVIQMDLFREFRRRAKLEVERIYDDVYKE